MFVKYWQLTVNVMAILTGFALLLTYGRMNFEVMTLIDHGLTLWGLVLLIGGWCSFTTSLQAVRSSRQVQQ